MFAELGCWCAPTQVEDGVSLPLTAIQNEALVLLLCDRVGAHAQVSAQTLPFACVFSLPGIAKTVPLVAVLQSAETKPFNRDGLYMQVG